MGISPSTPKAVADRYEKEYGFMCVNAIIKDAQMMKHLHADFMLDDMKGTYDVLVSRGWKEIHSKEEYDTGCAQWGVPPAFQKESRE